MDQMEFKGPKFGIVPPEVLQDRRMALPTRAGLVYLFTFRNTDTGVAFPGQKRIAEELGVHVRTVKRWVQEWLKYDWVTITKMKAEGKRDRNVYRIEWISPTFIKQVTPMSPKTGHECHPNIEGDKEVSTASEDFEKIFGKPNPDKKEWKEIVKVTVNDQDYSIQQYPIHVRSWIKGICELWRLIPPTLTKEVKDWIVGCESLRLACGEFGIDLLLPIFQDWNDEREINQARGQKHWWVSRPGSLTKIARAKAGELRLTGDESDDTVTYANPL